MQFSLNIIDQYLCAMTHYQESLYIESIGYTFQYAFAIDLARFCIP